MDSSFGSALFSYLIHIFLSICFQFQVFSSLFQNFYWIFIKKKPKKPNKLTNERPRFEMTFFNVHLFIINYYMYVLRPFVCYRKRTYTSYRSAFAIIQVRLRFRFLFENVSYRLSEKKKKPLFRLEFISIFYSCRGTRGLRFADLNQNSKYISCVILVIIFLCWIFVCLFSIRNSYILVVTSE